MSSALRVLVVDDQQIVREGLATILDMLPDVSVVGSAGDGAEALELVARRRPDVVLLDLHMPVLDGVAATRRIVAEHPSSAVLILTTFGEDDDALEALRAGARGVLTKDAGHEEISRALHQAAAGHMTLAAPLQARLLAAATPPEMPARVDFPDGLTAREAEVLGLIGAGFTNREIAERLVVSEATVKTHINHVFAKIGPATARQRSITLPCTGWVRAQLGRLRRFDYEHNGERDQHAEDDRADGAGVGDDVGDRRTDEVGAEADRQGPRQRGERVEHQEPRRGIAWIPAAQDGVNSTATGP